MGVLGPSFSRFVAERFFVHLRELCCSNALVIKADMLPVLLKLLVTTMYDLMNDTFFHHKGMVTWVKPFPQLIFRCDVGIYSQSSTLVVSNLLDAGSTRLFLSLLDSSTLSGLNPVTADYPTRSSMYLITECGVVCDSFWAKCFVTWGRPCAPGSPGNNRCNICLVAAEFKFVVLLGCFSPSRAMLAFVILFFF